LVKQYEVHEKGNEGHVPSKKTFVDGFATGETGDKTFGSQAFKDFFDFQVEDMDFFFGKNSQENESGLLKLKDDGKGSEETKGDWGGTTGLEDFFKKGESLHEGGLLKKIPFPYPVKVKYPLVVKIPVPLKIEKVVRVPVEKKVPYPVEKPYPYKVVKKVPVPVPHHYPVPVPVYRTKIIVHKKRS
jgi:hypothetical protein